MSAPSVVIRPSTAADADLLFRLFAENKGDEFSVLGLSQDLLGLLVQTQYRARCLSYAADFPYAEQFIVVEAGKGVGQLLLAKQGHGMLLVDVAVARDSRNRGIGTAALHWLLHRAAMEGRDVTLSARTDSPAARLYTALGFATIRNTGADCVMRRAVPCKASHEVMHAA